MPRARIFIMFTMVVGPLGIAITDETLLLACGPTDARAPITFRHLVEMMTGNVGGMPTTVWIDGEIDRASADPLQALQVLSGSCG